MSNVVTLYITKLDQIYDTASELQRLTNEKFDNLEPFFTFREHIAKNAETINQFKNISSAICKIIDSRNFDSGFRIISSKFIQLSNLIILLNELKKKINETTNLLPNVQVPEFEMLIVDCFNNVSYDNINEHKTKLEVSIRELLVFNTHLKGLKQLINNVNANIREAKSLCSNIQIPEFEKLIKNCSNDISFDTIFDYKTKLEYVNKQLLDFTEKFIAMKELINYVNTSTSEIKNLFKNMQVTEFDKLIKDCINNISLNTIDIYGEKIKEIKQRLMDITAIKDLLNQVKSNHIQSSHWLDENVSTEIEKLIEDCFERMSLDTISDYKNKLKVANNQLREAEKRRNLAIKHEFERIHNATQWSMEGLSRCCGAKFSGLFSKKCSRCGLAKDY